MKNFTNNFKQFTSRLSARWLIMALMLLLGTSSVWANYTIYYVNVNGWANPYCYAWILNGSSEANWAGVQMTKTGEKCLSYDVYKYDGTNDSSNRCIFSNKGADQTGDLTINKGKYYYNDKWYASISEIESEFGIDYLEILKGNKIAFYIGEPSSWGQSKFYLRKNSTTKASTKITFISGNNRLGVVSTAAETELYVTHSESWQGEKINQAPVAGGAYLCDNGDNYSECQNLNITALAYSFTLTETTIKTGETCSITEGTKPNTYQGNSTSIRYFVTTDNTNFTEVTFQNGALQTGSLAVGTYTIRPLITDGIIYAIGTDRTLTVETACEKPLPPSITINGETGTVYICSGDYATITAGTVDGAISYSLYKGNNDEPAQTNTTGVFEVGVAATSTSYRVTVTTCDESSKSSFVTLSKKTGPTASNYVIKDASKSKEYTGSEQTLTAEDITVSNNAGAVASIYFKQDGNTVDPINVGVYEVYVTTDATEDICAGDIKIGTFTINKKTPDENDFEYTDQTVTYNGKAQTATVTWIDGYENTGAITITYKQGEEVKDPINAGTYDVWVTSAASDNFNATESAIEKGTLTIKCAEITDVANNFELSKTSYNYGEEAKPEVSLKQSSTLKQAGLGAITTKYYNSSDQEVTNPTEVGTYTAKIAIAEGTGYCVLTETAVGKFTITCPEPAKVPTLSKTDVQRCNGVTGTKGTITITNYNEDYNGGNGYKFLLGDSFEPTIGNDGVMGEIDFVGDAETYKVQVATVCGSSISQYVYSTIQVNAINTVSTISLDPTSAPVCEGTTFENIETYVAITKTEDSEVNWYTSAQGGDALATSTPLMETSYFAEATLNGCSSDRAELTITDVLSVPVIPSIDIDNTTICSNDKTGAKITVSNPQVGMTYQVYKILGENPATEHGTPQKYSEGELYFNSMKEAGTYYVRAFNEQCPNAIAQSLDEILTVIDADATSISISPEEKTVNPWVPVTFTVTKQGNYDYTFSCKEGENDVTNNMVINKSGDTYVVKFPKPDGVSAATDLNGQVTFANKTYKVKVKLNADVQCGTFSDESDVTLTNLIENCPQP